MKTCFIAVLLVANSIAPAHAEDTICKPLGQLAVYAARERESGKTIEQTYLKMVNEGRIKTTGNTAEWAANTVAWVYEDRIGSKAAEKMMVQKCRRTFSKKP